MTKTEFNLTRRKFACKRVSELLELLSSENLHTRFFAEMALRDATST